MTLLQDAALLLCASKEEARKDARGHVCIPSAKAIKRAQNRTRILRFIRLMPFSSAHLQAGAGVAL